MSNDAVRPDHLPDFRRPPLNEVVLGVQFSPPEGYQQIYAGEVWNLYRNEFPNVQEQLPLAPSFETFGLPTKSRQLDFVTGVTHDRFWFLRPDGEELIQFQQDRLLHNWRKVGDESNPYPRFETMLNRFHGELEQLEGYLNGLLPQTLSINQCEISYINHIAPSGGQVLLASDWLRFVNFDGKEPDDFSIGFREVIHDAESKPKGRLICEASLAIKTNRQQVIQLTLTVRGAPQQNTIASAREFLIYGREKIVSKFADLTTDKAHMNWERIQ